MKISLLFTLCLFSGPVNCSDVVGYLGGAVRIYCVHQTNKTVNTYFCKMKPRTCTIPERVSVMNSRHYVAVDYRNLRLQDAGLYQCGDAGVWNHTVNLTVTQDPCCSGPKTVTGYLGKIVTISCSYPDQYKENFKNLQKQYSKYFTEVIDTEETQRDRFSISEDRGSKVVSVRIRDVIKDDGGVYYCGVWIGGESVSYYSLHSEIQLRVTVTVSPASPNTTAQNPTPASYRTTSTADEDHPITVSPASPNTTAQNPTPASYRTTSTAEEDHPSSSILITVCVCVVLLLIGGSALIFYRLRCRRTHDSALFNQRPGPQNTADGGYEKYSSGNEDISMGPIYECLDINTNQSDSVYQSLNRNTNQSDSVYQSLNPNTNQPDSVYQSLNPNTNQSDSVYQGLTPNSNQ